MTEIETKKGQQQPNRLAHWIRESEIQYNKLLRKETNIYIRQIEKRLSSRVFSRNFITQDFAQDVADNIVNHYEDLKQEEVHIYADMGKDMAGCNGYYILVYTW